MRKLKNSIIFVLYTAIIGAITGFIVWAFLKLNSLCIEIIWDYLPLQFSIPLYPIIICTLGGI